MTHVPKDRVLRRSASGRRVWIALAVASGAHVVAGMLADRYLSRIPAWMPATEFGETSVSLTLFREAPPPVPEAPEKPPSPPPAPVAEPEPVVDPPPVLDNSPPDPLELTPEPIPVEVDPAPAAPRDLQESPQNETVADVVPAAPPQVEAAALLAPLPVAPPQTPLLVGGAVRIQPRYPFVSRLRGEEGTVTVHAWIDSDGSVGDVEVAESSGFPSLDGAAVAAVRAARFAMPSDAHGRTEITVPIVFQLTN